MVGVDYIIIRMTKVKDSQSMALPIQITRQYLIHYTCVMRMKINNSKPQRSIIVNRTIRISAKQRKRLLAKRMW